MARRISKGSLAAVETIRNRLQLSQSDFSEALGYGSSAYGDMHRKGEVNQTVALAAEALMRRQAPGAQDELAFVVRIVRGVPIATLLDGAQTMVLNDQRYLLVPVETTRRSVPSHAGNGVERPAAAPDQAAPSPQV